MADIQTETQGGASEAKRPFDCSAWLEALGSPCSLYRGYTLRVEVKVAGAWHADTNWSEHEIQKALAHAEETRNDPRRKVEDVRVIRMRFEVVGSGGSASNEQ